MDRWPLIELICNYIHNPIETVTEKLLLQMQVEWICRCLGVSLMRLFIHMAATGFGSKQVLIAGGELGSNLIMIPPRFNPSQEITLTKLLYLLCDMFGSHGFQVFSS